MTKGRKKYYLPKTSPEVIDVPEFIFITIEGEGNPNTAHFADCIQALYTMSYGIKMIPKKGELIPYGFFDYTVYPLEGVWDLTEEAKKHFVGTINKDDFVYKLMIRQPDFVDEIYFQKVSPIVQSKNEIKLMDRLSFEKMTERKCIQMLHVGSYDNEPASFAKMEEYVSSSNYTRSSKLHKEIYLSDFRKVAPEKLKTVLRFKIDTK